MGWGCLRGKMSKTLELDCRPVRNSRGFDRSALVAVLPVVSLLPVWFVSAVVFWLPLSIFTAIPLWQFMVVALFGAVLLFLRPIQSIVLTRLLGTRAPTLEEIKRLDPAWKSVLQANHKSRGHYLVSVFDSDEINAFACGGHLVVVSSLALQHLPEAELRGVLAHELSHHLGSHTVFLTIGQWLSLPIIFLARIGLFFQHVAHAATNAFVGGSPAFEVIGSVLVAAMRAISAIFMATLTLSHWIGNIVGKGAEFDADRRVVDMGFGTDLANALRLVGSETKSKKRQWRDSIVTSHPPARTRIARIEALVRHRKY